MRLLSFLFSLSLTGCASTLAWYEPTSVPLEAGSVDVAAGEWVDEKQCRHWILYLLPVREANPEGKTIPYNTGHLIKEAAGRDQAIVGMSIDRSLHWWLVGFSDCQRLTGYRVFVPPPKK